MTRRPASDPDLLVSSVDRDTWQGMANARVPSAFPIDRYRIADPQRRPPVVVVPTVLPPESFRYPTGSAPAYGGDNIFSDPTTYLGTYAQRDLAVGDRAFIACAGVRTGWTAPAGWDVLVSGTAGGNLDYLVITRVLTEIAPIVVDCPNLPDLSNLGYEEGVPSSTAYGAGARVAVIFGTRGGSGTPVATVTEHADATVSAPEAPGSGWVWPWQLTMACRYIYPGSNVVAPVSPGDVPTYLNQYAVGILHTRPDYPYGPPVVNSGDWTSPDAYDWAQICVGFA